MKYSQWEKYEIIRLVEAALGSELTDHLGYQKHEKDGKPSENRRNGAGSKTVRLRPGTD